MTVSSAAVDAVDVDAFERDGWTVWRAALAIDECASVLAACGDRSWPRRSGGLDRWIEDPRWASALAGVIDAPVFLREQLVTKPAHAAGAIVPWHQDAGYIDTVERPIPLFATCFIALEPITIDNGCLWFVSGSHRQGELLHRPEGYLRTVVDTIDEPGTPVPLAAGDAAVFTSLTVHRSGGNTTASNRPAWMLQFRSR